MTSKVKKNNKSIKCSFCGTYSDEPDTIKLKPTCKCGRKTGWTETFLAPNNGTEWLEDE